MFHSTWVSHNLEASDVLVQHGILKGDYQLHSHDYTELVIILSGEGSHVIDDKIYPLQMGDVYVITGDTNHGYQTQTQFELINVLFHPDQLILEEIRKEMNGYRVMFEIEPLYRMDGDFKAKLSLNLLQLKDITAMCNEIQNLCKLHTREAEILMKTTLNLMIAKLSSYYNDYNDGTISKPQKLLRLAGIVDYIENNLTEDLNTETLAKKANFSSRHFLRIFASVFNTTPKQYILNLRMNQACKLLLNSNLSISAIASSCGYPDSSYFARLFFEKYEQSPRMYRNRAK